MNQYLLYEGAIQVVPLLLIALFLDSGSTFEPKGGLARFLVKGQDRLIAVLGFLAFMLSMFVVVGSVPVNSWTNGIVIAALASAVGLLFGNIWQRFALRGTGPSGDTAGD